MSEGHIQVRPRNLLVLDRLFSKTDVLKVQIFLQTDVSETGVQLMGVSQLHLLDYKSQLIFI